MKRSWAILSLLCLSGCPEMAARPGAGNSSDNAAHTAVVPPGDSSVTHAAEFSDAPTSPQHGPYVVQLDIYQLEVPFGALSRDDEFWKRVDETQINPADYDVLVKNGVRVGIAQDEDWNYFKSLIEKHKAAGIHGTATPAMEGKMEIPLRSGVDYQDLFYFDDNNILYGRTFEKCDNVLAIDFRALLAKPGFARVRVCPLIRGLRKHFEVTVLNEEREIALVRPEQIIDLQLATDIAPGHFLILGPSRTARWPTSLGRTFLVKPGHAGLNEVILLLVPHAYAVGEKFLPPGS